MKKIKALIIPVLATTVFLLPSGYLFYSNTSKAMKVFVLHKQDYVFTLTHLTENICNKKSGNHAQYPVSDKTQTIEAFDGCIMGADKNDVVKIYYNKNDIFDNGIVRVLIKELIIAIISFGLVMAFIIWRTIAYFRPPVKPDHEK